MYPKVRTLRLKCAACLFFGLFGFFFFNVYSVFRPMMVITQKITSMAFEIHDGKDKCR